MGVKKSLNPFLIYEGDDQIEIISVEANINNKKIRFITAYGPQQSDYDRKFVFFAKLSEEIAAAELAGCSVFIELDANSKVGRQFIKGDPCDSTAVCVT